MTDSLASPAAAEKAWQEYVAALDAAHRSRRLHDAMAAGAAWRRFLDLFITPAQRGALGSARPE
ncbi:MAG: hypothetical protein K0S00_2885 [Xanthobacteraceae bacterium]|jgi:hypothetical protein|nr:hypothetical protein [Xanthobacteraceae bacterium]